MRYFHEGLYLVLLCLLVTVPFGMAWVYLYKPDAFFSLFNNSKMDGQNTGGPIPKSRYQFLMVQASTLEDAVSQLHGALMAGDPFDIEGGEYDLINLVPFVAQKGSNIAGQQPRVIVTLLGILKRSGSVVQMHKE